MNVKENIVKGLLAKIAAKVGLLNVTLRLAVVRDVELSSGTYELALAGGGSVTAYVVESAPFINLDYVSF